MYRRRRTQKINVPKMISAEAADLIGRRKVLATGVIEFCKPYYVHDRKTGRVYPISYVLSIKTSHTIKTENGDAPIFISAWGKYTSYFYYRKLRKSRDLIGVSGIRKNMGMYKGSLWIILERMPAPILWHTGRSEKDVNPKDVILGVKLPAMLS